MATRTYAVIGGIAAAIAITIAVIVMGQTPGVSDELVEPAAQDTQITAFASFYPYYEFTKNVAGDQAMVKQFMPAGIEAHDWDPRAADIQMVHDADVFVYNGLGMEPYVDQLIASGEYDNTAFVSASKGVELIKNEEKTEHMEELSEEILHIIEEFEEGHITELKAIEEIEEILHEHEGDGHEHDNEEIEEILHEIEDGHTSPKDGLEEIHGTLEHETDHGHDHDFEYDPHIWLDPILVKPQVNNIKEALITADPGNAESYEQNASAYNAKLDEFNTKAMSELSECKKDSIVTFHNAFTYFGQRYGLDIYSLGGLAPEAEASASEIAEFVDFMRDNGVEFIFAEELIDPRLAQVIAEEAGAQVLFLSPLESLTPEEAKAGLTYMEKMEQNLESLKTALDCT